MISMIRPEPREYILRTAFGFSVEKLSQEIPTDFFQALPNRFTAAELPYYMVENPIQLEDISPVHACSLIEIGLLENLSLRQPGLVQDCIRGLGQNIENLVRKEIREGVLPLDLNCLLSPEKERLYFMILKGLANVLERNSFTLLIPFSVPAASPELIRQVSSFLRKSLLPWVKLRLDVYAHELSPGYSPEDLAGDLFMEIRSLRFVYAADTGNILVPEHIVPWLTSLGEYGFRGPCFFAPMAANISGLPSWIESNEKLIGKMESENKVGE